MIVRPAESGDGAAIADIVIAGWRAAYRDILDASYIDSASFEGERREGWEKWRKSDAPGRIRILVGDDGGRVVGWASFGAPRQPLDDPRVGELWGLYVDPPRWGTGVATALMGEAIRLLTEVGFTDLRLWVLAENPRARAFYERSGWIYTGVSRMRDFGQAGSATEVEMSLAGSVSRTDPLRASDSGR